MIQSTNTNVLVFVIIAFCLHSSFGYWHLPIVQRSSSHPIIRILDTRTHDHSAGETKEHGYDEVDSNWLALGQEFMPKVDEISYVIPPRKLGRSEHKKLKDGGAVNPNHFHFRVTR